MFSLPEKGERPNSYTGRGIRWLSWGFLVGLRELETRGNWNAEGKKERESEWLVRQYRATDPLWLLKKVARRKGDGFIRAGPLKKGDFGKNEEKKNKWTTKQGKRWA